jgi:hypothetical protein
MATAPTVKVNALAWRANLQEYPLEMEGACIRIETYLAKSTDKIRGSRDLDSWARLLGKTPEECVELLRTLVRANLLVISCGITELVTGYNSDITISLPGNTSTGIADPDALEIQRQKNREKQRRFQERKRLAALESQGGS